MSQEKAPEISLGEFKEWSSHPVTQAILNELEERKALYEEQVHSLVTSGNYHQATLLEGLITGLDTILLISYEDVEDGV